MSAPFTPEYHGQTFFLRLEQGGSRRLFATPLFVVLALVETTDLIFAVDSIPAIFSVSRGLAQFISGARSNGEALIVGGDVMFGAIRANQATISPLDATPIARLASEYIALVVPNDSPFTNAGELLTAFKANPTGLTWAGGSTGGTEHGLVTAMAAALGVPAERVNYLAFPGGRGPVDALLQHRAQVAVAGYGELLPALASQAVRAVVISAPEPLAGIAIPTLVASGVDIVMENWRGLFAPPDISADETRRLGELMAAMVETPTWRAVLDERHWVDRFLGGEGFIAFLRDAEARAIETPTTSGPLTSRLARPVRGGVRPAYVFGSVAVALFVATGVLVFMRRGRTSPAAATETATETPRLTSASFPDGRSAVRGMGADIGGT